MVAELLTVNALVVKLLVMTSVLLMYSTLPYITLLTFKFPLTFKLPVTPKVPPIVAELLTVRALTVELPEMLSLANITELLVFRV
jgi:hypothetical protein